MISILFIVKNFFYHKIHKKNHISNKFKGYEYYYLTVDCSHPFNIMMKHRHFHKESSSSPKKKSNNHYHNSQTTLLQRTAITINYNERKPHYYKTTFPLLTRSCSHSTNSFIGAIKLGSLTIVPRPLEIPPEIVSPSLVSC